MRVLFIGDVFGKTGRRMVRENLPAIKKNYKIDLVIANIENAAGGFGVTKAIYEELMMYGIDYATTGNHVFDQKGFSLEIEQCETLVRPANFPKGTPGKGVLVGEYKNQRIAIINLQGRVFMAPTDCPFRKADEIFANELSGDEVVIVDFHAEASSEKQALARYLRGRIACLFGTHTHVQTSDEKIIDGTGYITDAGMTGPYDSIIGVDYEAVIQKFTGVLPVRFTAASGRGTFEGVVVSINNETKETEMIERIKIDEKVEDQANSGAEMK